MDKGLQQPPEARANKPVHPSFLPGDRHAAGYQAESSAREMLGAAPSKNARDHLCQDQQGWRVGLPG